MTAAVNDKRHPIRNDEGFALVIVVGVMVLITLVAMGGFWLAHNSLNESSRVVRENKAFQAASSGLDRELQTFRTSNMVNGVYSANGTTPDGTYSIVAQATGNPYEYRITSTGFSATTSETVTQRFFFLSLWDMNIGAGPAEVLGGGRGFNGNASITGPFYARGKMDWTSSAVFEGGPLLVRDGALNVTGSGTVGVVSPIYLYASKGLTGNKAASNVYLVDNQVHNSVPDVQLPWVDEEFMTKTYDLAESESVDNLMGNVNRTVINQEAEAEGSPSYPAGATKAPGASEYYKYIGPVSGPSDLGEGTTALTIGSSSFGRWPGNGYDANGGKHDDFAFDTATGTLYIEGTVFVDGPVTFTTGVRRYVGNGTLIANGDVSIQTNLSWSKLTPAHPTTYEAQNPSPDNCMGIVTPGDVTLGANDLDSYYVGALFCNGSFSLYGTSTMFSGSALTGSIYGDKPNIQLYQNPAISRCLPESMPGAGGGLIFSGTWSRG